MPLTETEMLQRVVRLWHNGPLRIAAEYVGVPWPMTEWSDEQWESSGYGEIGRRVILGALSGEGSPGPLVQPGEDEQEGSAGAEGQAEGADQMLPWKALDRLFSAYEARNCAFLDNAPDPVLMDATDELLFAVLELVMSPHRPK